MGAPRVSRSVEIWSDVICPWCGLGQHRLERAIVDLGDPVEVRHRSFELDPSFPDRTRPVREVIAQKYRVAGAQLDAMFARVERLAAEDGLSPYVVGDNVIGNTRLAHELLAMAAAHGKEREGWRRLYRAYFAEKRSIFDVESLVALAIELGLDAEEARAALSERRYRARVDEDLDEARALGVTGVPFVVIDRKYAISGAQPIETFKRALERPD